MSIVKTYMLDDSVLVHDPNSIFSFEENKLLIPTLTIGKLRELGTKSGERGANARDAMRKLLALFGDRNIIDYSFGTAEDKADYEEAIAISSGEVELADEQGYLDYLQTIATASLDNTGSVSIVYSGEVSDILDIVQAHGAILVSKDAATRLMAIARNIRAEDYKHDKINDVDRFYSGRSIIYLPSKALSSFAASTTGIEIPPGLPIYGVDEKSGAEVERDNSYSLSENEFLVIKNASSPQSGSMLGRVCHGKLVKLCYPQHPFNVEPRNVGQRFAIEALMAPAEVAPLVILRGPAGTAKTFLATACGLEHTYNSNAGEFRSVLVTRQSSLLDESPGYLPGTEQEKVSPLLRSVFDNISALMPNAERSLKDGSTCGPEEELIARGILQVQAMTFMRGRSIANTYIIIDEAQNCTPQQLFAIVSRCAKNSKVVLTGDVGQIDNPNLDKYSNGLTVVSEKMRGSHLCWQVAFQDDECERSPLANEAIHRLA